MLFAQLTFLLKIVFLLVDMLGVSSNLCKCGFPLSSIYPIPPSSQLWPSNHAPFSPLGNRWNAGTWVSLSLAMACLSGGIIPDRSARHARKGLPKVIRQEIPFEKTWSRSSPRAKGKQRDAIFSGANCKRQDIAPLFAIIVSCLFYNPIAEFLGSRTFN